MNQWRNRSSSHGQLGHKLAFTKTDEEPHNYDVVCAVDPPEHILRPSLATGHAAEILEG
jgi:hypothetical protein